MDSRREQLAVLLEAVGIPIRGSQCVRLPVWIFPGRRFAGNEVREVRQPEFLVQSQEVDSITPVRVR